MNLGTVIRTARRAKDMTQDDLAGLLGVTLSAVSQWEQGKTMPDIALVPGICSALDISADMLFGLDPESKEDKIRAVIDEAVRMEERNEPPRKVLALLEDALAAYPDSMKLTEQTAFVLSALSYSREETPEDRQIFADRSLALYEKILRYSSDENLLQSAKQSLIYGYGRKGDFSRAAELAETMPTVYIAREELLFSVFTEMHSFPQFQYYKQFFIRRALEKLTFNCRDEDGKWVYNEDEMAAIYEKKLAVMEILYDGDYLLSWGGGQLRPRRAGGVLRRSRKPGRFPLPCCPCRGGPGSLLRLPRSVRDRGTHPHKPGRDRLLHLPSVPGGTGRHGGRRRQT